MVSTAGNANLSVADPATTNTGQLVNGAFALPTKLQARAASAAGTGAALADVGGSANPTSLLTYTGPISNDRSRCRSASGSTRMTRCARARTARR